MRCQTARVSESVSERLSERLRVGEEPPPPCGALHRGSRVVEERDHGLMCSAPLLFMVKTLAENATPLLGHPPSPNSFGYLGE